MTTPVDPISDPLAMPAAAAVLSKLMEQLALTATGRPAHTRITPGTEVVAALAAPGAMGGGVDECCEGIASVRITRVFQTDSFPEPAQRAYSEGGPTSWGVEMEVMVIRCGAQPGSDMAPTDAALTGDSSVQMDDAAAMRRTARCFGDGEAGWPIVDSAVGEWEPMSGDGNCLGGRLTLTVQVECDEC